MLGLGLGLGLRGFGFGNRNATESTHYLPWHRLLHPCRGGGLPPLSDEIEPLGVDAVGVGEFKVEGLRVRC